MHGSEIHPKQPPFGWCQKKTLQTDGINDLYLSLNWFSRRLPLHRPTSTELDGLKNPMDGFAWMESLHESLHRLVGCLVTIFFKGNNYN